jgi:hypothetical protein
MVVARVLLGARGDHLVGELPGGPADQLLLVGEGEVHVS